MTDGLRSHAKFKATWTTKCEHRTVYAQRVELFQDIQLAAVQGTEAITVCILVEHANVYILRTHYHLYIATN